MSSRQGCYSVSGSGLAFLWLAGLTIWSKSWCGGKGREEKLEPRAMWLSLQLEGPLGSKGHHSASTLSISCKFLFWSTLTFYPGGYMQFQFTHIDMVIKPPQMCIPLTLENWLRSRFWFSSSGWGLGFCIPKKLWVMQELRSVYCTLSSRPWFLWWKWGRGSIFIPSKLLPEESSKLSQLWWTKGNFKCLNVLLIIALDTVGTTGLTWDWICGLSLVQIALYHLA